MKNPFHNFIIYPPELILEEYLKSCRKKNIVRLISVWKICSSGLQKVTVRRYSHISLVNSEIKFYIILQFRCQIKIICISSFLGFPFSFFNFQRYFFSKFLAVISDLQNKLWEICYRDTVTRILLTNTHFPWEKYFW